MLFLRPLRKNIGNVREIVTERVLEESINILAEKKSLYQES